MFINSV